MTSNEGSNDENEFPAPRRVDQIGVKQKTIFSHNWRPDGLMVEFFVRVDEIPVRFRVRPNIFALFLFPVYLPSPASLGCHLRRDLVYFTVFYELLTFLAVLARPGVRVVFGSP